MNDVIFASQYDIVLDLKKEEPYDGCLHNGLNCTGDGDAKMGDHIGGHVEKTARKSELAWFAGFRNLNDWDSNLQCSHDVKIRRNSGEDWA